MFFFFKYLKKVFMQLPTIIDLPSNLLLVHRALSFMSQAPIDIPRHISTVGIQEPKCWRQVTGLFLYQWPV